MSKYPCIVVKGHQVASGNANDSRFPQGTISAQKPYFKSLGLDLSQYFSATINAKLDCSSVTLTRPNYSFIKVKWHQLMPAENFNFYNCELIVASKIYSGLIYQPEVETKIDHFQPKNLIEILVPYISNIQYGDKLHIICNHLTLQK